MNSSDPLSPILDDLRDEHRAVQPPPHIRARVLSAMDALNLPSPRRHPLWSLAFAACTLLFLGLFSASILIFPPKPEPSSSSTQVLPPSESTTAFIPLPASAGLPPPEQTSLLRVRLQESDLRQLGLELPESLSTRYTQVEFVVGEDGLARAIRFIQPVTSGPRP